MHPGIALFAMAFVATVLQVLVEPILSVVLIAHGAVVGVLAAHASGANVATGAAIGACIALTVLAVRASVSLARAVAR